MLRARRSDKIYVVVEYHRIIFRVKVFAFPNNTMTMGQTFKFYRDTMLKTLKYHPHIGMCRARDLKSNEHAIVIFKRVVQMGPEGIVICKREVMYCDNQNRADDDVGNFFKLKQNAILLDSLGVHH